MLFLRSLSQQFSKFLPGTSSINIQYLWKNFTLWDLISEQLNQSPCLRLINSYFSSPLCDSETYWRLITFVFEKTHILPLELHSDSITYMFEFWIIVLINVTNKVLNTDEYYKRELICWLRFMYGNVNSSTLSGSWVLNNIYILIFCFVISKNEKQKTIKMLWVLIKI